MADPKENIDDELEKLENAFDSAFERTERNLHTLQSVDAGNIDLVPGGNQGDVLVRGHNGSYCTPDPMAKLKEKVDKQQKLIEELQNELQNLQSSVLALQEVLVNEKAVNPWQQESEDGLYDGEGE